MRFSTGRAYQYVIIAVAVLLFSGVVNETDLYIHPNILLLLVLAVLMESIQIPMGRAIGTLTFGVVLGTLILHGPYVAAAIVMCSTLFELFKRARSRQWILVVFNAAQYVVCVFAADAVLQMMHMSTALDLLFTSGELFRMIPVIAAYMVTNHLLVYLLIWARGDRLGLTDFAKLFISDSVNYLISTPFAIFMLAFSNHLTVIFLIFLPLLLFGHVLRLYRKVSQLSKVHEVTQLLQSEFDLEKIYETIVASSQKLSNSAAVVLWVIRGDRVYPVAANDPTLTDQLPKDGLSLADGKGIVVNAVLNKSVELVNDVWKDRRVKSIKGEAHFESVLVVPLLSRHKVVGVITCYGTRTYAFSFSDQELITVLAAQVGVFIENAYLYRELQEATLRDPGTGLYNYRYFYQELSRRFRQAKAEERPLSIVILDIDHFKKYNDTYGHVVGYEVLAWLHGAIMSRQTGQVILKTVGDRGVVARYGGEEFAVILDEPLEKAKQSVEYIRRAVAHNKFEYQGYVVQAVTISVGVASYPDHDQDEKELLEKADQAMYWGAKMRGRNKVAIYTPDFDAHLFVDQLTGLYTYHYLHNKMMEEFSNNHHQSFALVFLNIVDFDAINRTFGFEVGNQVLREIAVVIKQNVRHGEVAARYGGDEFLLLVPNVDVVEADKIRERIIRAIGQNPIRVRENVITRVILRSELLLFPDEAAEEHQIVSMIPQKFMRISSKWLQAQTQDA